jgi:leader peptidase (prepilin peptidase)/N-methyltransferase
MSSVVALIFVLPSLINKSRKMSSQIPFGPYIIIAAIFYVSFSNQIKSFLL